MQHNIQDIVELSNLKDLLQELVTQLDGVDDVEEIIEVDDATEVEEVDDATEMKEVTVAAEDEEGLEEGLKMAEQLVAGGGLPGEDEDVSDKIDKIMRM